MENKNHLKAEVRYLCFVGILTLFAGLFFVAPDFIDNPTDDIRGKIILLAYWGIVTTCNFFVIYSLAAYKTLFAIVFPIYWILGSIVGYIRYAYSATITPMLLDATFHNDFQTSRDLITTTAIFWIAFAIIFSSLAVFFRYKYISTLNKKYIHLLLGITLLLIFLNIHPRINNGCQQRYPYNLIYNLHTYVTSYKAVSQRTMPNPDIKREIARTDSLTVVFILGESLRSDHLSINGYTRETTPFLNKETRLVSFPHIYSEYTYTNRSLPHILTRADSANIDRAFQETSFIPIFKQEGFKCTWIANQDAANTYIDFINECDTSSYVHPEKTVYVFDNWYDKDILPHLKNTLKDDCPRKLVILHTIGSHWYYNNHVPKEAEIFLPVTTNREVHRNTAEEIINSYDNTIYATDLFMKDVIDYLRNDNAIVLFLADHGEALGEEGDWLHASDNKSIKNPACFIWYSSKYEEIFPEKIQALHDNAQQQYRTDFLFHSILEAAHIPASIISEELNIFSSNEERELQQ